MPRPILATVSVPALRHNLSVVTSLLAEHAGRHGVLAPKVWAVIKARGYGHGMQQVVQAFAGANGLAMIDLEEVVQCREMGWQGPLLLLEGFFHAADISLVRRHAVTVVVHSNEQLAMLEAAGPGPAIPVWLKVDTGMSRLGFLPESLAPVLQRLETLQRIGRPTTGCQPVQFGRYPAARCLAAVLAACRCHTKCHTKFHTTC